MTEGLVRAGWWVLVTGFIAAAGFGAIYSGYWGVSELLAQRWSPGVSGLLLALAMSGATAVACRHRGDLLYG